MGSKLNTVLLPAIYPRQSPLLHYVNVHEKSEFELLFFTCSLFFLALDRGTLFPAGLDKSGFTLFIHFVECFHHSSNCGYGLETFFFPSIFPSIWKDLYAF